MNGYETKLTMQMDEELRELLHSDYDIRQDFAVKFAQELRDAETNYDVFVDPNSNKIRITLSFPSMPLILDEIVAKLTSGDGNDWDDDEVDNPFSDDPFKPDF